MGLFQHGYFAGVKKKISRLDFSLKYIMMIYLTVIQGTNRENQ